MQISLVNSVCLLAAVGCGSSHNTAAENRCAERNKLVVAFASEDVLPPRDFEVTHTLAYTGGMRYHGTTIAKLGYVVFANYPVKLHGYEPEWPTSPEQMAIVISFKTDNSPVDLQYQASAYNGLRLRAGEYASGWMRGDQSVQVRYYVGGSHWGPVLSSRASGGGALTAVPPAAMCGEVDLISERGTHLSASFNVRIDRDVWSDGPAP